MIQEVRIIPSGGEGKIISYGSGSRKNGPENFTIATGAHPTLTVEIIDTESETLVEGGRS